MRQRSLTLMALGAVLISAVSLVLQVQQRVSAQSSPSNVPPLISYQGFLTDGEGNPVTDVVVMQFCLYEQATGGSDEWCEPQSVSVTSGVFHVLLGESIPIADETFDGTELYLGVKVGSDAEMTPRRRVVSVGYAYRAESAETADFATTAGSASTANFATTADSATTANFATSAGNSDTVDGSHASAFAPVGHGHNFDAIPSGLIALFQSSCPSGWTRVSALDDKFLVGGNSYNTSAGGSDTHTHGAGNYSAPSHTHPLQNITRARGWDGGVNSSTIDDQRAVIAVDFQSLIAQSGGGGTITGNSGPGNSRPPYATVILCRKN